MFKKNLLSTRFSKGTNAAAKLSADQIGEVNVVRKKIEIGDYGLEKTLCVCGGNENRILAEVDRYGLPLDTVICLKCGTLRFDPYLNERSIEDFYTTRYQSMYGRSNNLDLYFRNQMEYGKKIHSFLKKYAPNTKSIFEIGCGAGGALKYLESAFFLAAGCDYSLKLVNYGKYNNLDLIHGNPFEALRKKGNNFDLIYLHHVFEHIINPTSYLEKLHEILKNKESKVLLVVPDISRIHSSNFPGGDARLFFHIAHAFNYSPLGMNILANNSGFTVEEVIDGIGRGSPEKWYLLRPEKSNPIKSEINNFDGQAMLRYLQLTEQSFRLGLTVPQLKNIPIKLVIAVSKFFPVFLRNKMKNYYKKLNAK